jgi:hypothetical protein
MTRNHKVTIGAVVAVLLVGAGVAWAAWSVSGTGTGTAKATTAQNLTIGQATVSGDLYPGFAGGDLSFVVTNPNVFPVKITAVSPNGAITSGAVGCGAADVSFAGASGLEVIVTAVSGGTQTVTLSDVVSMVANPDNACQGATFSVPISVTAESYVTP